MTIRRSPLNLLPIVLMAWMLTAPGAALAHPMGNFSINHYARLSFTRARVAIHYVLDMAEIPTVAEQSAMDADHDGIVSDTERAAYARRFAERLARGLSVTVGGRQFQPAVQDAEILLPPGAGGLNTLRLVMECNAPLEMLAGPPLTAAYRDANYAERTGWKEIVAAAGDGTALLRSTAASADRSRELTQYPVDPTVAAPQQTEAEFSLQREATAGGVTSAGPADTPATQSAPAVPSRRTGSTPRDPFTESIGKRGLTLPVILVSLGLAFLFGALHALSPGHGKAMVAAYLVGSRGTARHAVFLGGVVTLTHTISVYVLGIVTLAAARFVVPERLYPALSIGSGALIVVVGAALLWKRLRVWAGSGQGGLEELEEDAMPALPPNTEVSLRSLLALGITGGALPCPSALVVMLSAVALHRVVFGLALIAAFSLGLAAVLTCIGLMVVKLRGLLDLVPRHNRAAACVPVLGAALVTVVGMVLIVRALAGQI